MRDITLGESSPSRRFGQCLLRLPSLLESVADGFGVNAGRISPLCKRHGLAKCRDLAVISAIVVLFLLCCPSAVFRAIVSIVVNAIDAMRFRWPGAHVGIKRIKRFAPLFANLDATAAVVVPVLIGLLLAPVPHAAPYGPFSADRVFSGHAMTGTARDDLLSSKTAAACAFPIAQSGAIHIGNRSAIASTGPLSADAASVKNGPAPETFGRDIDESWHDLKFTMVKSYA
jgi:hypothetical protein